MTDPDRSIRVAVLRRAVPERLWANFAAATAVVDLTVVETAPTDAPAPTPGTFRLLRTPAPEARSMHRVLDRLDPEVVLCFGWSDLPSLASLTWARKRGRRAIVTSDSNHHDWRRSALREALKARLIRAFDLAWAAGCHSADYLARLGFPPDRITTGGLDTVDLAHFERGAQAARAGGAALRKALGLPERFLLCCARLAPEKNQAALLEAFAHYRARVGQQAWDLVLVGSGPLDSALRARAAALGLGDHVQFRGHVGYHDLPAVYGLASALALPSLREPWAVVVNEAAAAALPLLVSSRAGSADALVEPGVNGFLLDPDAPHAMADALFQLAHGGFDLAAMGQRSRELVQGHGTEAYGAALGALARRAVALPPRRSEALSLLACHAQLWREQARLRTASG